MPWVKFSDDWYDDPKIIEAGDAGALLWAKALSWSARNLTDGLIPAGLIRQLIEAPEPQTVAARLVEIGLLSEDISGGFRIANYLRYQPSRESVLAKREADKNRKSANRRAASGERPPGIPPDSGPCPERPGPGPVDPSLILSPSGRDASVDDDEIVNGIRLGDVYDQVLPIRYQANKDTVRNRAKWEHQTRANLPAEIGARARELLDRFDADAYTVAEVIEGRRSATYLTARTA